jgi:hypothetical protein
MAADKETYCAGMNSDGFCPLRLSCDRYIFNQPLDKRRELHLFDKAPYDTERTHCDFHKLKT